MYLRNYAKMLIIYVASSDLEHNQAYAFQALEIGSLQAMTSRPLAIS